MIYLIGIENPGITARYGPVSYESSADPQPSRPDIPSNCGKMHNFDRTSESNDALHREKFQAPNTAGTVHMLEVIYRSQVYSVPMSPPRAITSFDRAMSSMFHWVLGPVGVLTREPVISNEGIVNNAISRQTGNRAYSELRRF